MKNLDALTTEERREAMEPKWADAPLDRLRDKSCPHDDHQVAAQVTFLSDTKHWTADICIRCAHCGIAFEFVGLEAGWSPEHPMVDVTAQELRLPIKPKGSLLLPGSPGFTVRAQ